MYNPDKSALRDRAVRHDGRRASLRSNVIDGIVEGGQYGVREDTPLMAICTSTP